MTTPSARIREILDQGVTDTWRLFTTEVSG